MFYFEQLWLCFQYIQPSQTQTPSTHTNAPRCEFLLIHIHFTHSCSCFIFTQANSTLQEFANLRKYSEDWIESSKYIITSAELLGTTLPMLQVWKLRTAVFISDYSGLLFVVSKSKDKLCSGLQWALAAESWWCSSYLLCLSSILEEFPWQFLCEEFHWDADKHQCWRNEWDAQQLLWVSISRSYFCKLQILAYFYIRL